MSLSNCLKKFGNSISPIEKMSLQSHARLLQKTFGKTQEEAEQQAVRDYLNALRIEYDSLIQQAKEKNIDLGETVQYALRGDYQVKEYEGPRLDGSDDLLTIFWKVFAKRDKAFRYPTSDSKDLQDIFDALKDQIKGEAKVQEGKVGPGRVGQADSVKIIRMPDGKLAYLYQKDNDIWINASFLKSGLSRGSALYHAFANYAYNNNLRFIGDPDGLSTTAFIRRTENMLSSVLKFDTSDHLGPHERQILGSDIDWPFHSLDWKYGETTHNLRELLKASYHNVLSFLPELAHVEYSLEDGKLYWASSADQQAASPVSGQSQDSGRDNDEVSQQDLAGDNDGVLAQAYKPANPSPDFERFRSRFSTPSWLDRRNEGDSKTPVSRNDLESLAELASGRFSEYLESFEATGAIPGRRSDETPFGTSTVLRAAFTESLLRRGSGERGRGDLLGEILSHGEKPVTEENEYVLYRLRDTATFTVADETRSEKFIRLIQNKFNRVNKVQAAIRDAGFDIDESVDVVLAEEAFYGKAEFDLKKLRETYIEPLTKYMADKDIDPEELGYFLYARHASERNAHIAKINDSMQDGGSGMTNAQATEYLAEKLRENKFEKLRNASQYVYDMLNAVRDYKKAAGLLPEDIQSDFEYYVPLKGFASDEDGAARYHMKKTANGKGFAVFGREDKKALGRRSRAYNPLFQAFKDAADGTVRIRKNDVGQTFLKLVEQVPNNDFWTVHTDEDPAQTPGQNSQGKTVLRDMSPFEMHQKFFPVKRDGKQYYIEVKDEQFLAAMKNMGPEQLGAFLRPMARATRWLSALYTSYSPEFMFTNFMRDVQTAAYNFLAESSRSDGRAKGVRDPKKTATKIVRDVPKAILAIKGNLSGKKDSDWQKLYDQFQEDGAKTGYFDSKEVDELAKDAAREIMKARGGVKGTVFKAGSAFMNFVHNMNEAVENGVRLSAYKNAIDAGLTRKEATSLAKNLTVNFNRKGEYGAHFNALYAFFNAAVQGTANVARVAIPAKDLETGKRKYTATQKTILFGLPMFGFAMATLARGLMGEDDDGEDVWDKISDYEKERFYIVPKALFGGDQKDYYKFPMPYGFNAFQNIGVAFESLLNGHKKERGALWSAGFITKSFINSYIPFGLDLSDEWTKSAMVSATPTVAKPFAEVGINRNFFGDSIYNELSFPGDVTPRSEKARKSTSEAAKAVAQFFNWLTGGDEHKSGFADTYPEIIEHLVKSYSGGLGKLAVNTEITIEKTLQGETDELKHNKIPFYRIFNGKVLHYANKDRFYERKKKLKSHMERFKSLRGMEREQYRLTHKDELYLSGLADELEKSLKKLRKSARTIEVADGDDKRKKATQDKIMSKMEQLFDKFNREYNEAFNQ